MFLVTFRCHHDERKAQVQLISSPEDFEKVPIPEGGYFLDAIDLMTLERSCGASEASCRVACLLARSPNNQSALSHVIITATGELHPVPMHASGDALDLGDWRVLYSHGGVAHK